MTHDALNWEPARARLEDIALAYEQVQAADWPPATTSRPTVSPRGRDAGSARAALVECAGDGFVRCFADSIEATFGIDVVRLDRLTGGYSLSVAGRTVIVVSDTSNWFYQNWSLAHELGHIVQGTMEPLDDPDRDVAARERRANAFAADLLLPRPLMRTVEWKSASPDEIALFVWKTGVSTRTLVNRLKSLRYRIPDRVEVLLGSSTQTLLRSHARLLPAPIGLEVTARMRAAAQRRFPLSLLAAHREAVAQGRMHTHTLAWMLGADPEALERELAPGRTEAGNQVADLAHLLGFES